jgi:hypothetical protein
MRALLPAAFLAATALPAAAQKDWYNLDRGHPFEVTDARALERKALEFQFSPLDVTRREGGAYGWSVAPSVAVGLLPRTEFELGAAWAWADGPESRGGLAGVELGVLHALNIETRGLPALALEAEVLLPVGSEAPDAVFTTLGAIVTRTVGRSRLHLNAAGTFGPSAEADADEHRWRAGLAVDRALPLAATLLGAEVVAGEPFADGAALDWDVGVGGRRQLTPRLVADAGVRYRVAGDSRGWGLRMGFGWMTALARSRAGAR